MKLQIDSDRYLKQQEVFTGEMIACIADHLESAGLEGVQLREVTGKIAFEVACLIDDVSGIEFEGVEANPYLTFLSGEDELIHMGGN